MQVIGTYENTSHVPSTFEIEVMWNSFYLDSWWWFYIFNLCIFGPGVFIIFFIHFPKIDDEEDKSKGSC